MAWHIAARHAVQLAERVVGLTVALLVAIEAHPLAAECVARLSRLFVW